MTDQFIRGGAHAAAFGERIDYFNTFGGNLVSAIGQEVVSMGPTGNHGNVLELRSPLPFGRDNADHALEVIGGRLRASTR
jgi:4-aminobutyrate aminotransferase-like enzyme